MVRLFISYRSLDSAKVDMLVAQLRAIRRDSSGTPLYDIWQDKTHIVPGQNWWDQIVDGIIGCEVFLFMVSKDAVQSSICAAELSYARKRNRPIVPIVLEGEFQYNKGTGKNDLTYWELIPQELNDMQAQLLFYEGTSWVNKLEIALTTFANVPQRWADISATKPQDPRNANVATNNPATLYARACEAAEKLDINLAETLFLKLVNGDSRYHQYAREWVELLRVYDHLLRLDADKYLVFELPDEWTRYERLFPKKFIALFDPKDFNSRYRQPTTLLSSNTDVAGHIPTPPFQQTPSLLPKSDVGTRQAVSTSPLPIQTPPPPPAEAEWITRWKAFKGQRNADWTPYIACLSGMKIAEMEFCLVPPGTFQMGSNDHDNEKPIHLQTLTQPYWIARTPVTNAQWYVAVKAGAVEEPHGAYSLKRYRDGAMAQAPVSGVTWFEAQAFCVWQGCRLPTEREWEYAARGPDNLVYPWGNKWSESIPVWSKNAGGKPNDVLTHLEGQSWVGALHMSGNVWEWVNSLNKPYPYDNTDIINENLNNTGVRVLRGGAWGSTVPDFFRAAIRASSIPSYGDHTFGFRCVYS